MEYLGDKDHLALTEQYCKYSRSSLHKIKSIWRDLGYTDEQCVNLCQAIVERAQNAWRDAVQEAESSRQGLRTRIEDSLREISRIKQQLGPEHAEDQLDVATALGLDEAELGLLSPRKTLKGILEEVTASLDTWRVRRAKRVQEYETVLAIHLQLKQQLGMKHVDGKVDISTANLEFLQLENDKLAAEKQRRLHRLAEELEALNAICIILGEDDNLAAGEVHPSLRTFRDRSSHNDVLERVNKLAGGSSTSVSSQPDLSETTFSKLDAKIKSMHGLKAEREVRLRDVQDVLNSLWGALDVGEDAAERVMIRKMLESPYLLHQRTVDKCLAEVERLERHRADAMRELTLAKGRELMELCAQSHIMPPDTAQLLADMDRRAEDGSINPGQIAEVLGKLVRMVTEVSTVVSKRSPILSLAKQLQEAQSELAWHRAYSQDESRFKGRDATRNVQRAIKAEELRKRMPATIETLHKALADWRAAEGEAFVYDGKNYEAEILAPFECDIQEQLAQDMQAKAAKAKEKAALGKNGGVPTANRPPAGAGARAPAVSKGTPAVKANQPAGGALLPERSLNTPLNGSFTDKRQAPAADRPMNSARNNGVYGGSSAVKVSASKMCRSQDFQPGELNAMMASTHASSICPPLLTPPAARVQAGAQLPQQPSSATSGANTGTGCKDAMQATFNRIIAGSPQRSMAFSSQSVQQSERTTVPSASPVGPVKLAFSSVAGDDDDGDMDQEQPRDTPKSTAASKARAHTSPGAETHKRMGGCDDTQASKGSPDRGPGAAAQQPVATKISRIPRPSMA